MTTPLSLIADVAPDPIPFDSLAGPVGLGLGGCFCFLLIVLGGLVGLFIITRKKKKGDAPQTTPVSAPPPAATPPPEEDDSDKVLDLLRDGATRDLEHAEAQTILGAYLAYLASPQSQDPDKAKIMARFAETIEANLTVKAYNPSVLAEFGLDRMRLLAEVNKHTHRIGSTSRVLITVGGQARATTMEQLWDALMEQTDSVDLRSGQTYGVPTAQATEMMALARSR